MPRILLGWEIGANYGHVMRLATLARELARRGHEPVFAVKELTHVETVLRDDRFRVFQAPVWMGRVTGLVDPAGFAETLLRFGFLHPDALTGMCRAWRHLFAAVDPQMLVLDYAPTALLASRGLGLPRVLYGDSFTMPPRTEPMPAYRWWEPCAGDARGRRGTAHAGWRQRGAGAPVAAAAASGWRTCWTSTPRSSPRSRSSTTTRDARARAIGARWPPWTGAPRQTGRTQAASACSPT